MEDVPIFKASKKRKFARAKEDDSADIGASHRETGNGLDTPTSTDQVSMSEILKLRKQNRLRGGVQFTNVSQSRDESDVTNSLALVKVDQDDQGLRDISSRFTATTGQVVDIDRHMMAYIDSEIAKRQTTASNIQHRQQVRDPSATDEDEYTDTDDDGGPDETNITLQTNTIDNVLSSTTTTKHLPKMYQPQNALSEFDLGPSAHSINLARTNAAILRAQTGLPPTPDEPQRKPRRPRKPRLGRDGKPLRPRPRKRRNSDDLARDALVEQVLHEHRLETGYDHQQQQPPPTITGSSSSTITTTKPTTTTNNNNPNPSDTNTTNNEPADDRLAEQFRQEFMDAMAERRSRHQAQSKNSKPASKSSSSKSAADAILHGPKLGGSRSARAKMHASLQQQGKEGQGGGDKK